MANLSQPPDPPPPAVSRDGETILPPTPPLGMSPAPRPAPHADATETAAAPPAPPDPDPDPYPSAVPQQIAHYRLQKRLGRGGMGIVYLAEDLGLQRPVALKVMRPEVADVDASQRFLREARATAAVKHDHIVTIYQVGQDQGLPFLAMELLQGRTLEDWLQKGGTPTLTQILRLGREIALGLAAAHDHGLIHRDIKPANVWLEAPKGRVKILDFGLARSVHGDALVTGAGTLLGTPAYMPPEQARGAEVDARADLYSLGVVLYRLCTGRLPYPGPDPLTTLMQLANDHPPAVRDLNPDTPPELADLVDRLIAKDPGRRPATAAVVAKALAALERTSGTRNARAATPSTTAVLPVAPPPPAPRRRTAVAVLGLALVIGVLAAWPLYQFLQPEAQPTTPQVQPLSGPLDPAWLERVRDLDDRSRFRAVIAELVRRNPGLDPAEVKTGTYPNIGPFLLMPADAVTDLAPLAALPELTELGCSTQGRSRLADLTPLRGLPLRRVHFQNTQVADLTPLAGMPLERLYLSGTPVSDLRPLKGCPLVKLRLAGATRFADLRQVRDFPKLEQLHISGTSVADLEPLRGLGITDLSANLDPERDGPLLRTMPKLREINGKPAEEFFQMRGQ